MSAALTTGLFKTIDSCDWDSLGNFFTKDATYARPGYALFMGLAEVQKFYREKRIIASGDHILEQIVTDRHTGACWGRLIGLDKDGLSLNVEFADTYLFEQGRIKTRKSFSSSLWFDRRAGSIQIARALAPGLFSPLQAGLVVVQADHELEVP